MSKIVYLCPHCREGHSSPKHIEKCNIQAIEDPTPEQIFKYFELEQELLLGAFLAKVEEEKKKEGR